MPSTDLTSRYTRALAEHERAVDVLVPLLTRMAVDTLREVLPRARQLRTLGEINEDWLPILRIRRVLDGQGNVLFDTEVDGDPRVEETIETVNLEYLDRLLELTGDELMGHGTIEP